MSGETFEALLAPNLSLVRALVNKRLRSTGHADDVLQEILLRAFANRHQLRMHAKFRTWIWSIALNEIRTFSRHDRASVSLDDFRNLDVPDPATSPLERLESMERRDCLPAWIEKLSERD